MENVKQCEVCGRDFSPKTERARFCSVRCRVAHHRDLKEIARMDRASVTANRDTSSHGLSFLEEREYQALRMYDEALAGLFLELVRDDSLVASDIRAIIVLALTRGGRKQ